MHEGLIPRVEYPLTTPVVHLSGTFNLLTAPGARQAIRACLASQPTAIVVDLARVVTMTTLAVAMLAAIGRSARDWPGARLLLAGAAGQPAVLLRDLAGQPLARHFTVYGSVREALAADRHGSRPPEQVLRLAPVLDAPRIARELVRDCCTRWGFADPDGSAQLVASELVSNAVVHARTRFEFAVRLRDGALYLAVRDESTVRPRRDAQPAGEPAEHGRGLLLIDALATRWGRASLPDGKVVWARLGVRQDGSGDAGLR